MNTILFLSGEGIHAEEFLSKDTEKFSNVGVLLSYYGLKGKRQKSRLLYLEEMEEMDESKSRRIISHIQGGKNRHHGKGTD